jgi:tetrahydromethanopterin S-methyltransferase subunit G
MPIDQQDFDRWMQVLRDDIQGVHDRLDTINGRVRTTEQDVAVLHERTGGHGTAAAVGGGIAGVIYGAVEVVKWFAR